MARRLRTCALDDFVVDARRQQRLEQALGHSLANVPSLGGRTLVLVDTSWSMHDAFSKDGTLKRWDAAVIFGVALALRCASADVVSFASTRQTKVVFGSAASNSNVAVDRPCGPLGPAVIAVATGASIVKVRSAGEASGFPEGSIARARKVWVPSASTPV